MTYEHILVEVEDGVALITLNRPESLNAMNRKLSIELHDAVKHAETDDGVGCIVLTGAGDKAFSAGGDIHEQLSNDAKFSDAEMDAKRDNKDRYDISASPVPIIGMINGIAYGGAAVLASSLDMRIGSDNTKFRFLAAAYGRINSTWTLPNQVGWPIAKELLFTARIVGGEEAYRIGLLNHYVPHAQLREKTMEIAKQIAKNHRGAVTGIKKLKLQQMTQSLEEQYETEHDYTTHVMRGAKAKDAFPEFIERKGLKTS